MVENVYPAEVEGILYGHLAIGDVAVIGIPDVRRARKRLASYKVPKQIVFQESLPRKPSGKILRRELRVPFWEGQGARRQLRSWSSRHQSSN